jgi:1-acyl-sn-glycerol-3-phosphate acyltransferase
MGSSAESSLPVSKKWLVDGFCWYSRGLIKKKFQSMGLIGLHRIRALPLDQSVVVYANHASWWDPIVGMLCRQEYMPHRTFYAPIDSHMLEHYGVLKKMGFFGTKLGTFQGAQSFLKAADAILSVPDSSLWITPEGRFCDPRDSNQPLMPGLAHMATRAEKTIFIPMAMEYVFWNDSRPHVLLAFGESASAESASTSTKGDWTERLTHGLRTTQRELADAVIARDPSRFEDLIASRPTKLGAYDLGRRWVAWMRGQRFDPRHSQTMQK